MSKTNGVIVVQTKALPKQTGSSRCFYLRNLLDKGEPKLVTAPKEEDDLKGWLKKVERGVQDDASIYVTSITALEDDYAGYRYEISEQNSIKELKDTLEFKDIANLIEYSPPATEYHLMNHLRQELKNDLIQTDTKESRGTFLKSGISSDHVKVDDGVSEQQGNRKIVTWTQIPYIHYIINVIALSGSEKTEETYEEYDEDMPPAKHFASINDGFEYTVPQEKLEFDPQTSIATVNVTKRAIPLKYIQFVGEYGEKKRVDPKFKSFQEYLPAGLTGVTFDPSSISDVRFEDQFDHTKVAKVTVSRKPEAKIKIQFKSGNPKDAREADYEPGKHKESGRILRKRWG